MKFSVVWVLLLVCTLLLSACSSGLPRDKEITDSPWKDFQEIKAVYEQIIPFKTTLTDLRKIGIDPYATSNITILSYLDVMKRFMPNASITKDDLDPGLVDCIEVRNDCLAYEIEIGRVDKDRYGNVVLDMFRFKRKTKVSGWKFKAMFVLNKELVVYKLWSGSPRTDKYYESKKPLGPLQDSGDLLKDASGL